MAAWDVDIFEENFVTLFQKRACAVTFIAYKFKIY